MQPVPKRGQRGRALTILLFVLPFSIGTSATVWLGLRAPTRYVSRMTLQRMQLIDRNEQEHEVDNEAVSRSRAEFQTIARELQSYNRIESALSSVTEKPDDDQVWADRIESMRRDVDVAFAGTTADGGYSFNVRVRSADPDFGSRFLRTLGEQFLDQVNERKRGARERQEKRLAAREETLARELTALEAKLAAARASTRRSGEGAESDDPDIARTATALSPEILDASDLEREHRVKQASYQEVQSQRARLNEADRHAADDSPAFRISDWPSEQAEEIGRRVSGLALLAAAVGSVFGLLGALGAMLFESTRTGRPRF
ncbi:MAG: hypothetical protein HYR85_15140 [Planctomycetes bacterium]|nr:hypothetical protein [Planctomycetota bacterium]MBI3844539.1 hypothetical protein [Planctomycetota bacterium]